MRDLKAAGVPDSNAEAMMDTYGQNMYKPPATVDEEHPMYREAA